MANYTAISDISEILADQLRKNLVPDILQSEHMIAVGSPEELNDAVVGIHLYDIQECTEINRSTMVQMGLNRKNFPPIYLELYYVITVNLKGEAKYRELEEMKVLGRIIQFFHDHQLLSSDLLDSDSVMDVDTRIELLRLSMDEKEKIWKFPNMPYKAALYYKLEPIAINSDRYVDVERVQEVDIHVSRKDEG